MRLPGSYHIIGWFILLQHHPHGGHILPCITPVPVRLHVAQPDIVCESQLNLRSCVGDLAGNKLKAAERRFVIEQDTADREQVVSLSVDVGDVLCVKFGRRVRRGGSHRRGLAQLIAAIGGVAENL